MKKITIFSLLLLSTFTMYLPSATAYMVDTDGDILRNGIVYEIIPAAHEKGGGIELAATVNQTCPLTVVQSNSSFPHALPVRIRSLFASLFIGEGVPLTLEFTDVPSCAPTPSYWNVVEGLPEGPATKIESTPNFKFSIERAGINGYKILYQERGLGVYIDDDGIRRLVVTKNTTLHVVFRKAFPSAAAAA